jgi:hypothetical protein
VTDDPAAFETNDRRFEIARMKDPWARLYSAYVAVGESSKAAHWLGQALEAAPDFVARRKIIEQINQTVIDLNALVALHTDEPLLWSALSKQQTAADQKEAAAESLARARSLTEAELAESPDDESLAGFLADLLLVDTTEWSVLEPFKMTSAGGATLEELDDNSILAGGVNPDSDSYELLMDTKLKAVTALRLEALTDDSLPRGGPGRGRGGNFAVNWTAFFGDESEVSSVEFDAVEADYSYSRFPINIARWNIAGGEGSPHQAVYRVKSPIRSESGFRFRINMQFQHNPKYADQNLGRFRLSVTDDPAAFNHCQQRLAALTIEDPWQKLAAAYYVTENDPALHALLDRKPQAVIGIEKAAGWSEAIARLDRVMNDVPENADERTRLLRLRAAIHVRAGQWDRAATDYAESVELDPDANSIAWMKTAALWAYAGDAERHRAWSRKMAERFRANDVAADAERTVKVMLLLEHGLDPEQAPIGRFLTGLDENEQPNLRVWFLSTRGLLACRSGEFDEAQQSLDEAQQLQTDAENAQNSDPVLIRVAVQGLIDAKRGDLVQTQAALDQLQSQLASRGAKWRDDGSLDGSTIFNAQGFEHDLRRSVNNRSKPTNPNSEVATGIHPLCATLAPSPS